MEASNNKKLKKSVKVRLQKEALSAQKRLIRVVKVVLVRR